MGCVRKTYKVFDAKTGELIASGAATECAEQMGLTLRGFRSVIHRVQENLDKRYHIEDIDLQCQKSAENKSHLDRASIRKWDEFVRPLREKYGVEVWHP